MKAILSKLLVAVFCTGYAATLYSCDSGSDSGESNTLTPIELSRAEAEVSTNLTDFSLDLLKAIVNDNDENHNVAVSPLGAAMVSGMIGNALGDVDRAELMAALRLEGSDIDALNTYCNKLLSTLPTHDKSSNMILANSSWLNQGLVTVDEQYREILESVYDSQVFMANFGNSQIVSDINTWANNATNGEIAKIIDSAPSEGAYGVWLNALYFKGHWAQKFDKSKTKPAEFTKEDGSKVMVDMMESDKKLIGYRRVSIPQGVVPSSGKDLIYTSYATLLYGNGGYAFTAVMPDPKVCLREFVSSLPSDFWKNIKAALSSTGNEIVKMPRLSLDINTDLYAPLKSLGAENIFLNAKFPALAKESGAVSKFVQNINLDVDEEGSVVKVKTQAVAGITSDIPTGPIVFDRPFIYFIWEKSTGTIILAGAVMDPNK